MHTRGKRFQAKMAALCRLGRHPRHRLCSQLHSETSASLFPSLSFFISTYISSSASHSLVSISLSVPFQSDRLPFRDRLERSEWSEFRQGRRKGGNKWIEGKSERTLMPQKYLTIVVAYISRLFKNNRLSFVWVISHFVSCLQSSIGSSPLLPLSSTSPPTCDNDTHQETNQMHSVTENWKKSQACIAVVRRVYHLGTFPFVPLRVTWQACDRAKY